MKKIFIGLAVLLASSSAFAAKQTVLSTDTGAQTRSKLNANFTELYTADGLKADISCFADASAFNSCFDLDWPTGFPTNLSDLADDATHRVVTDTEKSTWNGKEDSLGNPSTNGYVLSSTTDGVRSWIEMTGGGTGIAHATADGNYYASKDGGWASLTGVYAPALGADDNYVTDAEKIKLAGIAEGAEVNVKADWNASSGDAQILNKPTIPTVSDAAYDATTWDGSTDAPSKNAIRDKIESMGTGGGVWGSITGTLSAQTDLQNALDAKQSALTADTDYLTPTTAATTYVPKLTQLPTAAPTNGRQIIQAVGGCSNTAYDTQATCVANGGTWTPPTSAWTSVINGLINDAGTGADDLLSASEINTRIATSAATRQPADADLTKDAVVFVIDGGGSAITTGIKADLEIPWNATITSSTLVCDQSGSIVLDLWRDTYANYPATVADTITASAKPTLSASTKAQDTTLTGWTTALTAGDILRVNVDSASTVTRCTLSLQVAK